ncbi:MAG: acyltransferase [Rikenellaceae bacterium]
MTEKILLALVAILHIKWVAIAVVYPFQIFEALLRKNLTAKWLIPFAVPSVLLHRLTKGGWIRFTLHQISTIPSNSLRRWLYKGLGAEIGDRVMIHFKTEVRSPHLLKIGRGTIVGDNVILDARCGLTIGENVNFSSNVSVYTQQHDHRSPYFYCPDSSEVKMSVEIDNRAWLGSNVVVLP